MSADRREGGSGRRTGDRPKAELPAPIPGQTAKSGAKTSAGAGAVDAQILSGGQRRGLKAGAEVFDRARSTYLGAEYSGAKDRRPPKGRIAKTDV
jgi:hypothetical protein